MDCSKCGQELKEGVKFCTKCGTKFENNENTTLPIISIVLSAIGIVGYLLFLSPYCRYGYGMSYIAFLILILPIVGILLALVAQKKQNSVIGFVAGVIPCVFLIARILFGRFY